MRLIIKSHPPGVLQEYCRKLGASYEDMDREIREATLLCLLNEQGWVCGYCQQKIKNPSKATIEHFCERTICNGIDEHPDKTLDYTNLMAVCLGDAGFNRLHCDKSKARFSINTGLPIEVSPWITTHMAAIRYSTAGSVTSSFNRHNDEIKKILNLNLDLLKDRRQSKYHLFFSKSQYDGSKRSKDKMRRLLQKDLEKDGKKFTNDFPGLAEWMLTKYC